MEIKNIAAGEDACCAEKENALIGSQGAHSKTQQSGKAHSTKKDVIRTVLRRPHGLNRFEAERHGDHCLNSTIAELRAEGCSIHSQWETVPTRHNPKGARVLRYWLTEVRNVAES